jgi:urease accessory protein UreF
MPAVAALADEASTTPFDDIGGYAILADHASILHETLETRIYRT